jgi:hypothetical protein
MITDAQLMVIGKIAEQASSSQSSVDEPRVYRPTSFEATKYGNRQSAVLAYVPSEEQQNARQNRSGDGHGRYPEATSLVREKNRSSSRDDTDSCIDRWQRPTSQLRDTSILSGNKRGQRLNWQCAHHIGIMNGMHVQDA